ncbi:hypothetical protein BTO20_33680 [Mycobacterium dioxanotrophicus]|jgi:hypothetical protein|uniref:DUF732 domain-containing protein n=1 Tax=Mycobacterium dioxanotrophicus TaxID=482462 RepID=A0A1Y0CCS6_9MYCO|nr:hypothetical protein [Mycobacterium dioxanotrophicus]ART72854.1 hypothetical protein BTO20_33680 [Mycobacterium dioxanotrophicus]
MNGRKWALALLTGGALAITTGSGLAHAQPDPSVPVIPSILDQLVSSTPALSVDPSDRGGPYTYSDDVGMVCQNLTVHCR